MPKTISKEKVIEALKQVYDPELPLNIYDLGLIYDITMATQERHVAILMTLTTPSCPAAPAIIADVEQAVGALADVDHVEVTLTFDPPYTTDRLTEAAKVTLGLL